MYVRACLCVHVYVYIYIHTYIDIDIDIYIYIYIYICTHTYMCIDTCVYISSQCLFLINTHRQSNCAVNTRYCAFIDAPFGQSSRPSMRDA